MKKLSLFTLVLGLVLYAPYWSQAQTTIDFNSVVNFEGLGLSYTEGGFVFSINDPGDERQITGRTGMGYQGTASLYDNNLVSGAIKRWTIRRGDNTAFQFRGIFLKDGGFADVSGSITGYKNGNPTGTVSNVSFSRTATAPLDFSANPIFHDVDEIRIEAADINFYLDHFTYGPPTSVGANDPAEVLGISLVGNPASTATTVSYTVTFSKAASKVDAGDFVLTKIGSATGTIASVTGSGTTYTAVIDGISGEGSIRLDLKAGTDIENDDELGGTAAFTGGQSHYVTACFMETFDQGETDGATTFSGNGETFTMAGNWTVNTESPNTGLGGSAFNLKQTSGTGPFTLTPTNGEITVKGLYLYLSSITNGTDPTDDGSVTIRGLRSGSPVYTFTKSGGFETDINSNSGYTYIDFSAETGDHTAKVIDQLEISIDGAFVYLNLDNFSWCEGFVPPAINSSTYDAFTGKLVVTGTDFLPVTGANNDIIANKFTFTGEGGATYKLTDTQNGEISGTSFTLVLSATDRAAVNTIMNNNGISSSSGTTYNLAAAEDWAAGADATRVVADMTGNSITVSNVAVPAITAASYDAATGTLTVTGTGFLRKAGASNDIVANTFTLMGEGGATYTLSDTQNGEISSGTSFTLVLSVTDRAAVNAMMNKNGTSSNDGTIYNLAAAEDWAAGADAATSIADTTGNGITVSNVAVPVIIAATYNAVTGTLTVTGTGFLRKAGTNNDIVAEKFTLTGEGGATYTLTDTQNGEISSGTSFTLVLSTTDRAAVNIIMNKNGTSSSNGTTYNLAAAEDWAAGADAVVVVVDMTGNGITVSNVAVPAITTASYDAATGILTVTGTGFLSAAGANNDIVANKFTLTGEGGATYTLTDTQNGEISSGTSFTLVLSITDRAAMNAMMNKNGTSSTNGTTYNLAAAEDWAAGADAAVPIADTTGNGVTVSNVAVPAITAASYDAATGTLVVTGTGLLSASGATNDIVANAFTFTGESGDTYILTDTQNGEISSGTSFTLVLSATDRAAVNALMNKNGTSSTDGTTYNLAADEDWAAGAAVGVVIADMTGNGVTASNVNYAPTDIALGNSSINQSAGVNAVVGTLGSTDPNAGNTFTYTLVSGTGSTNNADFNINGTSLRANDVSLMPAGTYSVRIETSDQDGATFQKIFNNITVVDDVEPTVIITSDKVSLKIGETAAVTFTLSETSINFAESDVAVSGGALSGFSGSGATYTAIFTPAANTTNTATIDVAAGTFTDAAGNDNIAASQQTITVDTEAPTVSISSDKTSLKAGETAAVTFTLSETSADFVLTDVTVTDGTLSGFSGSGTSYTATFTPPLITTATATINIGADVFTDAAGNNNTAATQLTIAVDTETPRVSISSDKTSLNATETATLTFIVSEALTNFSMSDISVTGGTLSDFTGSGAAYSATFTPSANTVATATIDVNAGTFNDVAGNSNAAATQVTIAIDTEVPSGYSITIDQIEINLTNQTALSFTFSGAEVGTDFDYTISSSAGGTPITGSGTIISATEQVTGIDVSSLPNGTLTSSVTLTDPSGNAGNPETDNVTKAVNYRTAVNTSAGASTFTESSDGTPTSTIIDNEITVLDPDNSTLASTTVSITGNFQSGEDILAFVNDGSTMGNIDGSYDAATGVLTLTSIGHTALILQWQAALRTVMYSNNSSNPNMADRTISFVANDGLDDGIATTKVVTVQATNNVPVITNLDADAVTFTEGGPAVLIDAGGDAMVSDPDSPDFDGGTLSVTIVTNEVAGEDIVAIRNEGMAAGQIGVVGGDVHYDGTHIGLLTGGTGGIDLVVTFLPTATPSAAQALIKNLTYSNLNTVNPSLAPRTIRITLRDGDGGTSANNDITVNITAVNDVPTITTTGGSVTFTEPTDGDPVPMAIDPGLTVADPDNTTLSSATVSITGNFQAAEDILAFVNDGGTMDNIAGSYNASIGVLTLTSAGASATLTEWQAALQAVTYSNSSQDPSTATRTISFVVNDGIDTSSPATKDINVVAVNTAPVAVDDHVTVTEDIPATGNVLTNDSDPEGNMLTVYLVTPPQNGTVVLNPDGSFTYTPNADYADLDSLEYQVCDNGASFRCDTAWVYFTIEAVNDAPTITILAIVMVDEDVPTPLTGISFSDIDAGNADVTTTFSVASGTLSATSGGGVTASGSGTGVLTLVGSIPDINAFVAAGSLVFTTALNRTNNVILTVGIDDGGNTGTDPGNSGTGSSEAATTMVTLAVTAVNDVPVNVVPIDQTIDQDGVLVFSTGNGNAISVSDVDAGGGNIQVTLTATNGVTTLSGTTGLTFISGSGTNDATMTFQGTIADINNALEGLAFMPTSGYNGAASLEVATDDLGATGSGGAQVATDVIGITVNPTNPRVTAVGSTDPDGLYKLGDVIALTVLFDQPVTVDASGGSPTLLLETGTIDQEADYQSGSGSNTLTFSYTVQAGDVSADLDYPSATALVLNGATLQSASGEDAVLALPAAGGTSSIAGQHALVIDGIAPAVTSVAVPANGYYRTGDVLGFTVQMDDDVTVDDAGGTPYLELLIGTATVQATYTGGTGSDVLTFSYTVQAADQDLDGVAIGGDIIPDGGSIQDAAGNDALLALNGVAPTDDVFVYSVNPSATLSTTAASPTNAPFTTTATFSEAVTGFVLADITTTNATLSDLLTADNVSYTIRVTPAADGPVSLAIPADAAVNIGNNGNTVSNTLGLDYDATAAATPIGLAAVAGDTEISLAWTANTEPDVVSYRVYGGTATNPTTELATVPAATLTYLHTGLTNGTTYYYRITTIDAAGNESAPSATVNGVPMADQAITFDALDAATYGDGPLGLTATASSGSPVTYTSSNPAIASVAGNEVTIHAAGTVTLTANQGGDAAFHAATPVAQTLTVHKATLTVTAEAKTKVYGTADPALTYTYTGLATGDTEAVFTGAMAREPGEGIATYAVTQGSLAAGDNYTITFAGADFVITPATVTGITLADGSFVFDGTAKSLAIAGTLPDGTSVSYTGNSRTDVGTQEVTATVTGDNYETLVLTADLTITKATITGITLDGAVHTYDGSAKTLAIDGDLPAGVSTTYTVNGVTGNSATNAGTYEVIATLSGANHATRTLTAALAISKAQPVITVATTQSHVYDGTEKAVIATLVPAGLTDQLQYSPQSSFTNVGEHRVRVYLNESMNYLAAEAYTDFSITPAEQDGLGLADLTVTYDGSAHILEVTGAAADATVVYTINEESGNSATDAGSYHVNAVVSRANHADETLTGTLYINKATAEITAEAVQEYTYDGTEKAVEATLNHTETPLVYAPQRAYTAAGTYTVTVSAAQSRNYHAVSKSFTLRITPSTRSIDFPTIPAKTYGDADFDAGATASSGETITYTSSNTAVAEIMSSGQIRIAGAGEATITATVPENGNYSTRPQASQTLMVGKAAQSITFNAPAEVDRNAGTVPLDVSASSGLPVSLSIDDEEVATLSETSLNILRLGTVRITATQTGDANHEAADPVTVTVRVTDPTLELPIRIHKAVSPNGDGINEYLIIEAIKDYPENRVRIFNRNGTVVYEASGYNNGTMAFRGIGTGQNRVQAGTYFYVAEIRVDGEWKYEKGWFVLRY